MINREKTIYKRICKVMQIPKRFDEEKGYYILDLKDAYLYLYPSTGKINHSKKRCIFRDEKTTWTSIDVLEKLLKEVETI